MSRLGNSEDVSHLSGLLLAGEGAFMLCPVSVGFQKSGCDALLRRLSVPAEEGLEGARPLGQHHFPLLLFRLRQPHNLYWGFMFQALFLVICIH